MPTFFHNRPASALAEHWFADGPGQELLAAESQLLSGVLDEVFGYELLQLGSWGNTRSLLDRARTRRQTILGESTFPGVVDVVGRCGALPLQSHSVDAVLLPHTLEYAADPRTVIREAHRVLTGEGQLLVLGFRPWSLWGLRAVLPRGMPQGFRQLLPDRRIRDWLAVLGCEVVGIHRYLRRGPLDPRPAGGYLIRARKRLYTPTPIRPIAVRGQAEAIGVS
ncbi:MAG: hypothetical protein RLZZ200_28 [Pseudomonadota bacterium]